MSHKTAKKIRKTIRKEATKEASTFYKNLLDNRPWFIPNFIYKRFLNKVLDI